MASVKRIGLIGYGYLGSYVYEQVTTHPEWGLGIAFVVTRSQKPDGLPPGLHFTDVPAALETAPDLVVELAHADVTARHGEAILARSSYMPLSVSALADADLEARLTEVARRSATTLYVPHGAATGLDTLSECRDVWETVTVTMKKPPRNLDYSAAPQFSADTITEPTVLFDGPTRQICAMFPRNVNTHAAVAVAGIGFDRTRSVLVADPALKESVIEIEARGNGVELIVSRRNPLAGVSGILTQRSALGCILRVNGQGPVAIV